jgi:predicted RNase H-like nuclease (RuvC/YqgF family)
MTKRICEHCGSDLWRNEWCAKNHDATIRRLNRALKDMTERAVKAEATLALAPIEREEVQAGFQRKLDQQRRQIRSLEKKLREARHRPAYAEEADASAELPA